VIPRLGQTSSLPASPEAGRNRSLYWEHGRVLVGRKSFSACLRQAGKLLFHWEGVATFTVKPPAPSGLYIFIWEVMNLCSKKFRLSQKYPPPLACDCRAQGRQYTLKFSVTFASYRVFHKQSNSGSGNPPSSSCNSLCRKLQG
jgi:hypothetical protein